MEKRIGNIFILLYSKDAANTVNSILSEFADIILSRQGLPLRERSVNLISIIVEAENNQINSLAGKLGKVKDTKVKTIFTDF